MFEKRLVTVVIDYKIFNQEPSFNLPDYQAVCKIARSLHEKLSNSEIQKKLTQANQPNSHSKYVQAVILPLATDLGFVSEKKGLFTNHPTKGLRPDYFLKAGNSGILLEVERGKTTQNNMDLLDFWKCHICSEASYLFLIVPSRLKQSKDRESKPYNLVKKRIQPFFEPENYTNVLAVFLYGYY